ncbi:MAG: SRPBCC family protein [Cognatishimia sp.]
MSDIEINKHLFLAAPRAHVWSYLTKADLVAQWFNLPNADFTLHQEFELTERDTGEILCWGTVREMRPMEFMAWDFTVGPANGHMSRVEWHLSDHHSGTKLTLRHSGLPDTAAGFDLLLALDKGWHGFLDNLYQACAPNDYEATISVPVDAKSARVAILEQMPRWWSDRVEATDKGFTIRFNNSHVTFAFDATDPLIWHCTQAHMIIDDVQDTGEWQNTQLIWQIQETAKGCDITLTHKGLNETLACLDVCTRGWQHFFETSLKAHLSGQEPAPQTHETA